MLILINTLPSSPSTASSFEHTIMIPKARWTFPKFLYSHLCLPTQAYSVSFRKIVFRGKKSGCICHSVITNHPTDRKSKHVSFHWKGNCMFYKLYVDFSCNRSFLVLKRCLRQYKQQSMLENQKQQSFFSLQNKSDMSSLK